MMQASPTNNENAIMLYFLSFNIGGLDESGPHRKEEE